MTFRLLSNVFILVYLWDYFIYVNQKSQVQVLASVVTKDLSGMLMFTDLNEHETCIAVFDYNAMFN